MCIFAQRCMSLGTISRNVKWRQPVMHDHQSSRSEEGLLPSLTFKVSCSRNFLKFSACTHHRTLRMTSRSISATSTCQPADTTTRTLSDLADTIFTPPASCLQNLYKNPPFGNDTYRIYTYSSLVTASGTTSMETWTQDHVRRGRDPSCFPPNFPTTTCLYPTFDGSRTVNRVSEQTYVYSPARCPESYAAVTSSVDATNTKITRAVCCPG